MLDAKMSLLWIGEGIGIVGSDSDFDFDFDSDFGCGVAVVVSVGGVAVLFRVVAVVHCHFGDSIG